MRRTIQDIQKEIKSYKDESQVPIELKRELHKKIERKSRYWNEKEIENLRGEIYRKQKKLEKLLDEKRRG